MEGNRRRQLRYVDELQIYASLSAATNSSSWLTERFKWLVP